MDELRMRAGGAYAQSVLALDTISRLYIAMRAMLLKRRSLDGNEPRYDESVLCGRRSYHL